MHCYKRQGFGSRIISPISGAIIDFLEEIYVYDTDLIITRPEMVTPSDTQVGLKNAVGAWASWINASGGAINPKKSQRISASYTWVNGRWQHTRKPDLPMTIPLLDGLDVDKCQGEVSTAKKALGVLSTVDGNDKKHLEENVTRCVEKWISKMTNGHLPAKLGWVANRFKLLLGVRYGLATLAMPLKIAARCLF